MFRAVSMKLSPLATLLVPAEKSTTSAPSRRAASEKLSRVRVEFSKNRLAIVWPVSRATFSVQPFVASLSRTAVSRINVSSSADRSSSPSKWVRVQGVDFTASRVEALIAKALKSHPGPVVWRIPPQPSRNLPRGCAERPPRRYKF